MIFFLFQQITKKFYKFVSVPGGQITKENWDSNK
jgi:hypothetical protein